MRGGSPMGMDLISWFFRWWQIKFIACKHRPLPQLKQLVDTPFPQEILLFFNKENNS